MKHLEKVFMEVITHPSQSSPAFEDYELCLGLYEALCVTLDCESDPVTKTLRDAVLQWVRERGKRRNTDPEWIKNAGDEGGEFIFVQK